MTNTTRPTRKSKTRNEIYEYLLGTKEHPSADTIYRALRPTLPTLSLGTVYTNLKLFEDQGLVARVANVKGIERYDADTSDHVHFICDKCDAVLDVMDSDIPSIKNACNTGAMTVNHVRIVLHGICDCCADKS